VRYRDNGGVIGPYDVASISSASGVWSLVEEEIDQLVGQWPLQNPPFIEYMALSATGGSYVNGIEGVVLNYPYNIGTFNPQLTVPYNTPYSITVGSLTVIAYPNTFSAIRTIPATLSYAVTNGTQRTGYRVYKFLAGSGSIIF
jgi:hypothetical protein